MIELNLKSINVLKCCKKYNSVLIVCSRTTLPAHTVQCSTKPQKTCSRCFANLPTTLAKPSSRPVARSWEVTRSSSNLQQKNTRRPPTAKKKRQASSKNPKASKRRSEKYKAVTAPCRHHWAGWRTSKRETSKAECYATWSTTSSKANTGN